MLGLRDRVSVGVRDIVMIMVKVRVTILLNVERGSSVVERRTRNQVSPGSNPSLLPFRRLGIFVLSIDGPLTQLYK